MRMNVMLVGSVDRPAENQSEVSTLQDIHNEFFAAEQTHRRRRAAIRAISRLPLQAMTNHSLRKTKFRSYVKADTAGRHLHPLPVHRCRLYISGFFTTCFLRSHKFANISVHSDPGLGFLAAGPLQI